MSHLVFRSACDLARIIRHQEASAEEVLEAHLRQIATYNQPLNAVATLDEGQTDVQILDVFQDVASVRVDAHGWIDYMHLARFGDDWKIVNVLWEIRAPSQ